MKIKYLGHSAFLFDELVVTDPFSNIGYDMEKVKAKYLLSSHNHFDHNNYDGVSYKSLINSPQKVALAKELSLKALETFHDDANGQKRGINIVYSFTLNGVSCCHLGDLGESFSVEIAEKIGRHDILFIPIGGRYTINADEAFKYVDYLKPKIVVPMHFKTKRSTLDIQDEKAFINKFNNIKRVGNIFEITKENLPDEITAYLFTPEDN